MLVDTRITIAYRCPSCGSFEFFNTSVFAFLHAGERSFTCRCGNSVITVGRDSTGGFRMTIPCISCGNDHIYIVGRKNLLDRDVNVFYCPETGIEQCFLGDDGDVRAWVDRLEKEWDELIDKLGYDSYFKNTRVMLDALNRVHDIAEQGYLYCECGSSDIELMLSPDSIHLKCRRCSGRMVIRAASNRDLKDIMTRQHILLVNEMIPYDQQKIKSCIRQTDRT